MKRRMLWTFYAALLCAFWAKGACAAAASSFWEEDVWSSPERPFLYYGMGVRGPARGSGHPNADKRGPSKDRQRALSRDTKADPPAAPTLGVAAEEAARKKLESLTTLPELQAEVKARLEAAVMDPTPAAIALYLQANAFMLEKASSFAAGWKRVLMDFPQYDNTASHPTVNAASTALARADHARLEETLEGMKDDWGLVFFADASDLTRHMAPVVKDFAERWKLETVWVSQVKGNPVLKDLAVEAVEDARIAATVARGLTMFPALVLVRRGDAGLKDARLVATGVASATDLMRRITLLKEDEEHPARAGTRPTTLGKKQ